MVKAMTVTRDFRIKVALYEGAFVTFETLGATTVIRDITKKE